MNFHKGNPDAPTGNLLVFCYVQGKSPLHPDARIIVTNVVVSFVSASSNSFPVVIFPPDSLFSQAELDQLIGLNEFYDVLQVEDFEIPMGMDESEYVQERMENLNQNVIEYVELCRHYIEGRVEDLPADDGIETEAGEEPVSEEAALDSIQDFLTETAHPRAEIVPLQTAGGPTNEIEETVLIEDLSAEPVEMGGELFADTADDVDVEVVEFTAHPDELEQPVQVDGGLDDQGADVVNPDDEPADDDVTDPSLATPRVQEVAFDTSQGARVRDAMRYLKFNYPKYDIERFERILKQPGHSARKLANLYMEKYRAVFDERYEAAAELKTRIEKLEHSLFPSG